MNLMTRKKPALKNIYCKIPFILSSKQDKSNLQFLGTIIWCNNKEKYEHNYIKISVEISEGQREGFMLGKGDPQRGFLGSQQ